MSVELSIGRDQAIERELKKSRKSEELYGSSDDESDIDECDDECESRSGSREEYDTREDDKGK